MDKKRLKFILEVILEKFNSCVSRNPEATHGLCIIAWMVTESRINAVEERYGGPLSQEEHDLFLEHLVNSFTGDTYWDHNGIKTSEPKFYWPPYDYDIRRKWLEDEIKKLSDE